MTKALHLARLPSQVQTKRQGRVSPPWLGGRFHRRGFHATCCYEYVAVCPAFQTLQTDDRLRSPNRCIATAPKNTVPEPGTEAGRGGSEAVRTTCVPT